ncbi:acyl-CoA dehydrogenase [Streptomyces noursei ATCC 11455]|uniref:acyl-CoA dehydrogenase family protein n=1 Tax=Streptomyces noursei TaxID=1971 RepID=UPI00081C77C5|nr:acyl-CoA dehydrogenase [Streptomyces noursei ATCC 11455]
MVKPAAHHPSTALEAALGDPFDPGAPVSYHSLVTLDEREQPPLHGFAVARQGGLASYLIPRPDGGRLTSFEETLDLLRVLARRDPVLSVGYGASLFAALPVWMWGTVPQRTLVAERLTAGDFGAIAISEELAGSDVLATATTATRTPAGFRLAGRKWPVSNATRGTFCTVLARSGTQPGLFLLDTRFLPADRFRHLPQVPTHGLRGNDLSGLDFDHCEVPATAQLGPPGRGVEMLLTASSYARVLACGVALGAADAALRIATARAHERQLYGRRLLALPPVRALLSEACLDLLTADCVARAAARATTLSANRARLWTSVAKYVVPLLCEKVVRNAAHVLSTRFYLREPTASGMLQKLVRDLAATSIVDGTSPVQLNLIASALRGVGAPQPRGRAAGPDLADVFTLTTPTAAWHPRATGPRLQPVARDEIVQDWSGPCLQGRFRLLDDERATLRRKFSRLTWSHGTPRAAYALAHRHCLLHAAAACAHTWTHNHRLLEPELAGSGWLAACWDRLLTMLGRKPPQPPAATTEDALIDWLSRTCRQGRWPSPFPLPPPNDQGPPDGHTDRRGPAALP